jgi:L-alanine-DL-glutamate epimerase-like enolase superfamily enzyme
LLNAATRCACLIELSTDENIVGIAITHHDVRLPVSRIVNELLLGADPRATTGLWQRMSNAHAGSMSGNVGIATATLDQALWDVKAKANEEPLWKALGGSQPRVNVHASCCDAELTDASLREFYDPLVRDFGLRAAQLKVGFDPEKDLRRLHVLHDCLLAATDPPTLMIDAHESWTPKEAIRRICELESHFDLTWVAAPTRERDFLGNRRVSEGIRSAVCAGKQFAGFQDFLPHLHHRALDVIAIDPAAIGITSALQVADAAFGFELPTALSESVGNINAHIAGALPSMMSMEVRLGNALDDVVTSDVRVENGWAVVGDRPGNGLVVDRAALKRAAVETFTSSSLTAHQQGSGA